MAEPIVDEYESDKVLALRRENEYLKEEVERLRGKERKYLPTFGELLDRLTITQLKEVKIPEHRDKYAEEIKEILHDLDVMIVNNEIHFDAKMLRYIIILAQYNNHIWINESNIRRGIKEGNSLELSHSLNAVRCLCKNLIQGSLGGRKDYKIDNAEAFPEWIPSWD